ncbi:hypothetical protein Emag_007317 [Eimeria magna]
MSDEEAVELGRRAIYHAAHRDGGSGGCITVTVAGGTALLQQLTFLNCTTHTPLLTGLKPAFYEKFQRGHKKQTPGRPRATVTRILQQDDVQRCCALVRSNAALQ